MPSGNMARGQLPLSSSPHRSPLAPRRGSCTSIPTVGLKETLGRGALQPSMLAPTNSVSLRALGGWTRRTRSIPEGDRASSPLDSVHPRLSWVFPGAPGGQVVEWRHKVPEPYALFIQKHLKPPPLHVFPLLSSLHSPSSIWLREFLQEALNSLAFLKGAHLPKGPSALGSSCPTTPGMSVGSVTH